MKDPIVQEIHKIREKIAKEHNYNLKQILNHIKEEEKKHLEHFAHKEDIRKAS